MIVEIIPFRSEDRAVCSSIDVAETFEKRHYNVLRDIDELRCSKDFRKLNFCESSFKDDRGKERRFFYMTRDGFTLLAMGYNGDRAMQFKEAYIHQFNIMEKQLKSYALERERTTVVRRALTDSIQKSDENERMHGHAYSNYTNVIYKALFGMNAKQLREKYDIDKGDDLRSCFTEQELRDVQSMEMMVSGMLNLGWEYGDIKQLIAGSMKKKQLSQANQRPSLMGQS